MDQYHLIIDWEFLNNIKKRNDLPLPYESERYAVLFADVLQTKRLLLINTYTDKLLIISDSDWLSP